MGRGRGVATPLCSNEKPSVCMSVGRGESAELPAAGGGIILPLGTLSQGHLASLGAQTSGTDTWAWRHLFVQAGHSPPAAWLVGGRSGDPTFPPERGTGDDKLAARGPCRKCQQ